MRKVYRGFNKSFLPLKSVVNNKEIGIKLSAIWLGIAAALALWLIAGALGLLWSYLQGMGTYYLGIYIYVSGFLGVFLGSIFAGSKSNSKGWFHGLWVGLFLGGIAILFNLNMFPQFYSLWAVARQLLVWSLWGITGGYLGFSIAPLINKNKDKKKITGMY